MAEKTPRTDVTRTLTDRERQVLEAVVRTYVDTAEPAGSRTVSRRFELGVSPATVRNTMSDLEEKGYLFHPHTSAGRVPTDLAYRFFVDQVIRPGPPSQADRATLARELEVGFSAVERLVQRATRALSVLTYELGLAIAPRLDDAVLEKLDLIQVSSDKVLMVATLQKGLVRTLYIDLPGEVPQDTLVTLTVILNERLGGLTLAEIRRTLPDRLKDTGCEDAPAAEELLNIFMQAGGELFDLVHIEPADIHIGQTSVLAAQPEFTSGERLKGLLELTEQTDFLAAVLGSRDHRGGLKITIGTENDPEELSNLTLVTSEYRFGGLKGVIGVIGPTRMPYEKVVAIVDYTSRLVNQMLVS